MVDIDKAAFFDALKAGVQFELAPRRGLPGGLVGLQDLFANAVQVSDLKALGRSLTAQLGQMAGEFDDVPSKETQLLNLKLTVIRSLIADKEQDQAATKAAKEKKERQFKLRQMLAQAEENQLMNNPEEIRKALAALETEE